MSAFVKYRIFVFPARCAAYLALLLMVVAISGCAAVRFAQGAPGEDVSKIDIGIPRAEAEATLGQPLREWTSESGVKYYSYAFNRGVPSAPDMAAANVFVDVITLGAWELFALAFPSDEEFFGENQFEDGIVVVSYDANGRIQGLFDEFDVLPPDGRSTRRPEILGAAAESGQ